MEAELLGHAWEDQGDRGRGGASDVTEVGHGGLAIVNERRMHRAATEGGCDREASADQTVFILIDRIIIAVTPTCKP